MNQNERKITEQPSLYRHLEKMTIEDITANINNEDKKVALIVEKSLPQLNKLIETAAVKLRSGGRMFYLGAGSSGRLAVLDAIELPTTYGIPDGLVNVVLAGGIDKMIQGNEEIEDDTLAGWRMLKEANIGEKDIVIGISASGATPFVLATLEQCRKNNITTGCIVSNPETPIAKISDNSVEVITGPEFLTGSTRMKCGTAQKMLLDIISTTVMIQLGTVKDNLMVNMQPRNEKMIDRSIKMLMEQDCIINYEEGRQLLLKFGNVKKVLDHLRSNF